MSQEKNVMDDDDYDVFVATMVITTDDQELSAIFPNYLTGKLYFILTNFDFLV